MHRDCAGMGLCCAKELTKSLFYEARKMSQVKNKKNMQCYYEHWDTGLRNQPGID